MAIGPSTRVRCYEPTGMNDFRFVFRLKREGDTSITKLAFFDSNDPSPTVDDSPIDSPAQCQTTTVTNDAMTVGFAVSGPAPFPCGILKTGTVYTITVGSIGTSPMLYRFECDTDSLTPLQTNITTFETGNVVPKVSFRTNKQHLRFNIVQADGNKVPAMNVQLGRHIKLRAIYDKDFRDHRDNLGSVFHIPFLDQDTSKLFLKITTPGTGTVVRVSGELPGSEFETYYPVKRDVETEVNIPDAYRHPDVGNAWATTKRAIKVETVMPNEFFSVRATTTNTTTRFLLSAFMSLPDNILGMSYNCYTGSDDQPNGQILVYAIEDSTSLVVTFNAFPTTGITINGVTAVSPVTVSMDEYDVLNIRCASSCKLITLTSDKPVGVVGGHEREKIETADMGTAHYASQVAPISTYGKRFIFINPFRYQLLSADPTGTVTYRKQTTGSTPTTVPSGTFIKNVVGREEYQLDENVLVLLSNNQSGIFTMPYPATHQWALRYYIFMEPPGDYSIRIIAQQGDIAQIEYRDSGITDVTVNKLGDIPGFNAFGVRELPGTPQHEFYRRRIATLAGKGPALVEFRAGPRNRPFLLIFRTGIIDDRRTAHLPMGVRYGIANPCVNSSSDPNVLFGDKIQTFPGDGIDNDCDGFVDEEFNDNTDTDGDSRIDEDLAPNEPTPHTGIYVDTLKASNNAQFDNSGSDVTVDLMTGGCSAYSNGALAIQPFKWNKNIGEMFDSFHILDTPSFPAFYIRTPRIYFRVTVGFCVGDLTGSKCDMSCQAPGRRRRDDNEFVSMDTSLEITNIFEEEENIQHSGPEGACAKSALYWIPIILVSLTILTESGVIVVFILCRLRLNEQPDKRFWTLPISKNLQTTK